MKAVTSRGIYAVLVRSTERVVKPWTITPDTARAMLGLSQGNRSINKGHAQALAAEMEADRFDGSLDLIRFTTDGVLCDGHHRLHAIILSGKTLTMQVQLNVPVDSVGVIDGQGRPRTAVDQSHFMGVEAFTTTHAAICKAGAFGFHGGKIWPRALLKVYDLNRDHVVYAAEHCNSQLAVVQGAVACAHAWFVEHKDDDALERLALFCDCMTGKHGDLSGPNSAALRLKAWMRTLEGVQGTIRGSSRSVGYARVDAAIKKFCDGVTVTKLVPATNLYPRLRSA